MTSNTYIFFDVDGVLNSESDWKKSKFSINKNCMENFSSFINILKKRDKTPHLVICSTWRQGMNNFNDKAENSKSLIDEIFSRYNLKIEDATPITANKSRQDEIEWYIKKHNITSYIVIDDDPKLYPNQRNINLYIPDYHTGLTKKDIKRIIKQLK